MKVKQKVSLHNRFDIEVRDSRTGKIRQRAYAENIILNQAWAQILATGRDWFNSIAYGTGTGTILATRTALFTPLSIKTATDSVFVSDFENNFLSHRQKIVLIETEHIGAQISEVGIASSSSNTLCTHALIKDMSGNSVTINKTDVDVVTIYATVFLHPNTEYGTGVSVLDFCRDTTGTYGVGGFIRTILGRRCTTPYYSADWGYRIGVYTGDENSRDTIAAYLTVKAMATLDTATKKAVFYQRIPSDSANVNGLRSFIIFGNNMDGTDGVNSGPSFIGRLRSTSLTQAQVVEQIGTGDDDTTDFSTTFPFIPSGTVIKVDGTPVSPTIYSGLPRAKDITQFMRPLAPDFSPVNFNALKTTIFENPFYTNYGITSVVGSAYTLYSSDDAETWTEVLDLALGGSTESTVGAGYVNKRYWKLVVKDWSGWGSGGVSAFYCSLLDTFRNVRFASAPAEGAVITAEYTPECATKDINHVLDIEVTLQLGEYTP